MVAPTVDTISPNTGLSLGDQPVRITGSNFNDEVSGGTVRVYFNDVLVSEGGVIDSTEIIVVTPGGPVGAVDVRVENVGAGGAPVEPTTVVDGFTYELPNLATRADHSLDNAVLIVSRTLIADLRRTVIDRVLWGVHPEFVDAFGATEEQELQAEAPHLKLVGPTIQDDRFYAINGRFQVGSTVEEASGRDSEDTATVGGTYQQFVQPVTVRLDFQYVGVGRSKGEALNLLGALTRYFNRTDYLVVPIDGNDPANGTIQIEMSPVWEQRGELSEINREGYCSFVGALVLRGVHTVGEHIFDGVTNDGTNNDGEVIVTVEPQP